MVDKFHKRCHKSLKETCTDPSCNYRHPLRVSKATKPEKTTVTARSVLFYFHRRANNQAKYGKKGLGKLEEVVLLGYETSRSCGVCISGCRFV